MCVFFFHNNSTLSYCCTSSLRLGWSSLALVHFLFNSQQLEKAEILKPERKLKLRRVSVLCLKLVKSWKNPWIRLRSFSVDNIKEQSWHGMRRKRRKNRDGIQPISLQESSLFNHFLFWIVVLVGVIALFVGIFFCWEGGGVVFGLFDKYCLHFNFNEKQKQFYQMSSIARS